MFSYTKRYVNVVSLFITILIYLTLINSNKVLKFKNTTHLISNIFKKSIVLVELKTSNVNQKTEENKEIEIQNNIPIFVANEENKKIQWKIIIPKISLEAEICEGTSKEIMDKYVGHFEETSLNIGNVGLAAHNRGYNVNYFSDIKKLKYGDEIIYKYNNLERKYLVSKNIIIKDEDWSYLSKTDKNTITLITCVENEPQYRRCVQAIEE